MSLEFNDDNSYIRRTGAANLGSATSGTYLGWYFKNDSTNGDDVLTLGKSGKASLFRTISATQMRALYNIGGGATFNANNGEWIGLAVTVSSAGVFSLYTYQAGAVTLQYTEDSTDATNVVGLYVGQDGGSYTTARGCHRYQRYWAGRVLNSSEIQAEFEMTPSGGTPAASATSLYLSWPLATGTDTTDWTGNSRVPTISGAVTSAEEPTIGGGAESTVTPAPAALAVNGRAPSTSIFSAVRIREVLVSESGSVAGDRTGINLAVWYSGVPTGAPDVSLAGLTTDPNGTTSWSIATGTLALNQPIFMLAYSGSPPDTYTCGRLVPNYE